MLVLVAHGNGLSGLWLEMGLNKVEWWADETAGDAGEDGAAQGFARVDFAGRVLGPAAALHELVEAQARGVDGELVADERDEPFLEGEETVCRADFEKGVEYISVK